MIKFSMRHPAHYAVGILATISAYWSPALPFVIFGGFLAYEIKQDIDTQTVSFMDIYEGVIGLCLGIPILIAMVFLGVPR